MGRRALLTGFEPFRQWARNSSEAAVTALAARRPDLATAVLPVDHGAACEALDAAVAGLAPQAVLLTGLADEQCLRLELRARRPAHVAEGPALRHGVWPWAAALDALRAAGAPARLSADAGRYVCETTYWHALARGPSARIAFLHVPPLSDAWPPDRLAAAVAACLDAGLEPGLMADGA